VVAVSIHSPLGARTGQALKNKKGQEGQEGAKNAQVFLPLLALLVLSCFSSAFQAQAST
jgi:hypothetical protein